MLEELAIPTDFVCSEDLTGHATITNLETWKQKSITVLHEILDTVKLLEGDKVTLKIRGDVVFAVAPFASRHPPDAAADTEDEQEVLQPDPWLTAEAQALADGRAFYFLSCYFVSDRVFIELFSLTQFSHPSGDLATQVLTQNLKPIFKSSPHPHLHSETGRKLPTAAGGSMAMQDYYEGQRWKEYPGVDKVVLWCVRATEVVLPLTTSKSSDD